MRYGRELPPRLTGAPFSQDGREAEALLDEPYGFAAVAQKKNGRMTRPRKSLSFGINAP